MSRTERFLHRLAGRAVERQEPLTPQSAASRRRPRAGGTGPGSGGEGACGALAVRHRALRLGVLGAHRQRRRGSRPGLDVLPSRRGQPRAARGWQAGQADGMAPAASRGATCPRLTASGRLQVPAGRCGCRGWSGAARVQRPFARAVHQRIVKRPSVTLNPLEQLERAARLAADPSCVAITCWESAHNPVGRARVLYDVARTRGPAVVFELPLRGVRIRAVAAPERRGHRARPDPVARARAVPRAHGRHGAVVPHRVAVQAAPSHLPAGRADRPSRCPSRVGPR